MGHPARRLLICSAARPHGAARITEVATILADHRLVAALRAPLAVDQLRLIVAVRLLH